MVDMGKVWPDWKTVRIIGRGSFGTVYEIERDVFGHLEKAALKVISIPQNSSDIEDLYVEGADKASITQRFKSYLEDIAREYSLMAEMKGCNNIVYCDDLRYIQHDDGMGWDIYIKMELLESLPKVLGRGFSEMQIIKLGLDMCNALVACKGKSVVHRDIKPQNIFVAEDGTYKLGDFGIAKTAERTTSGTKTGTYKYMAPEVYNNQPYGSAADIYSLGLVLYWLLNERRTPFLPLPPQVPSASAEDEARKKRFDGVPIPAPAHGSKELKAIVLKACAYDPSMRYASAADMRKDLEQLYYGSSPDIGTEKTGSERKTQTTVEMNTEVESGDDTQTIGEFGKNGKKGFDSDPTVSGFTPGGKKNKKKQSKKIVLISIGAMLIIMMLALGVYLFYHQWTDPTCTVAQMCTVCGKVRGKAIGHKWTEVTCSEPQKCSVCGEIRGDAAGHLWVRENCFEVEHCKVCGIESQTVAGHQWEAATYGKPQICSDCGLMQGPVLGSAIAANYPQTVGLRADGTVIAIGDNLDTEPDSAGKIGPCEVYGWRDIISVSAGHFHTVGLRRDGTVVSTGRNHVNQGNVAAWNDIIAISAGTIHTVGLRADGTVVATGDNAKGQCNVSSWNNIVSISACGSNTVGLRSDGTVVAVGNNDYGQCNVSSWTDIVAVAAGNTHTVGLKSDGTVVAVGDNRLGQCDVATWNNVTAISANFYHTVALTASGRALAVGDNFCDRLNVSGWSDLIAVVAGRRNTLGLRSDGTVVAVGFNEEGQSEVFGWRNIGTSMQ